MAYFTPTQQWFYDPMRLNEARMGVMSPQLPSPPIARPNVQNQMMPFQSSRGEEESPVSRGIAAGIGAGRQTIDIDQGQHDRLMGLAIAKMFGGMGNSQSGSVLGGLNQGLSSGIDSYMDERARMAKLNAMELERQDNLMREMQRQQEREQQRQDLQKYRAASLSLQRERLNLNKSGNTAEVNNFDLSNLPPLDKSTRTEYSIDYSGSGKLLSEIGGIKKSIDKLKSIENEQGKPLVSQANPYIGGAANYVKDNIGRYKGEKSQLNRERLEREVVNSKLQQFMVKAERALKGGQLTQGMYDRFAKMKTFPSLSQGYDTVDNLLGAIEEEAKGIHKASEMGLRSGFQVTPYELEKRTREKENVGVENSFISEFRKKYPQINGSDEEIEEYARSRGLL